MNDKERILMLILERLYSTQVLCLRAYDEIKFRDGEYVHFGGYDDRPIQRGDLVMAQTGSISDWKIAWVHTVVTNDTCILREIGSNRLCNYGNGRFVRIAGMHESLLLEGDKYLFKQKIIRAFQRGDEYIYRFGGVDFLDDGSAKIWIREMFGGLKDKSEPFSFEMKWNKNTSIKKILETMIENGYGTRKFEVINV
jgi:hypothetical protein